MTTAGLEDGPRPGLDAAAALPVAIRATHEDLSQQSIRFLRYALERPEAARRVDYRSDAALPEWMRRYPYELQPWPTFVGARKLRQIEQATVALARLVESIPERIFGGDPLRLGEFYGWPDELLMALLLSPPNGLGTCLARGDFVDDGEDFKCLELNIGATIGGWQDRFFARTCLALPSIAAFLAREGVRVRHRDTWRSALTLVLENGCRLGHDAAGRFDVAVAINPGDVDSALAVEASNDVFQEVLRDSGTGCAGEIVRCTYQEGMAGLTARDGALFHRDRRISAVIEATDSQTPADVYRCFKARRVGLYNGPLAKMLGDKRSLALLSQHEDSDLLTAAERELVRRHLPWSREVVEGHTTYHGEPVDLLDFALAHRESLVLKAAQGRQGIDVYLGSRTSPEEWRRRLVEAAGMRTMLLQEYVTSRPYLFQCGDHGWARHQAVWGTFSFGGSYGGAFLRLLPLDRGPEIINSARGATEGLIFEVDAPPGDL
jgi:hypothetical protein